jgi:very-short-patch-repair endonuclease
MAIDLRLLTHKLRKDSTGAEVVFWKAVRNRQLLDLKFVRQFPIPYTFENKIRVFVVDFYCHSRNLAIELDGPIHENQLERDTLRSLIIKEKGIQIIRYANRDIEKDFALVITNLIQQLSPLRS